MDKVEVNPALLKEASDTLKNVVQQRDTLAVENIVLRDVLQLLQDGQIDPLDAQMKVAEYLEDPTKLQIVKLAGVQMVGKQSFGTLEDSDVSFSSNAEEVFQERIRDINS